MLLSRDALLGATTLPTETIQIPELGGAVIVRGLSGTDRDAYETSLFMQKKGKRVENLQNARARLVVLCVVTEAGERVFTPADVAAVGAMRADVLDKIFTVAKQLSGLSDDDVEELGQPSA